MSERTNIQIETVAKPESQSQFQIETLKSQHDFEAQSSSVPNSDTNSQIAHSQPIAIAEASHTTVAELSHNPQNPSKIPIRPQKIRKLSIPIPTPTHTIVKPSATQDTADDASVSAASFIALTSATTAAMTPVTPSSSHSSRNRRRSATQASRALPQVIKPMSADGQVELAIRHLRDVDPVLVPLIDMHPPPQFETHHPPFLALTKSILYQQLAYKAGTSIYTRFVSLCGGEEAICPDSVLALSPQQLKQIGVSGRKATYLYDLANKYKSGILSDDTVVKMDDRSLFTMLSMVKGIGSWSVHMFMIFSLHRPDVLPVSDLGVRKGVQLLYGLDELPRPSQMERLCEKWRPYRSVGSWYMWRFIEGKGASTTCSAVTLEGGNMLPLHRIEPQQDGHQHQHQNQLQFVESVNGIGNIGACIWNQ